MVARIQQTLHAEGGFTFVELLAVVLLLGILVLVALPNYFGAENSAKSSVDRANVRSINAALALYRFNNGGSCPTLTEFSNSGFLDNPTYFPDSAPVDPWTAGSSAPYVATYDETLCRVQMVAAGPPIIDHQSGQGH